MTSSPSQKARGCSRTWTNSAHGGMPEGALQTPSLVSTMGVHRIVRLRQMVQQWRRKAASNIDRTLQVISPGGQKLKRSASSCSSSSSSSPWGGDEKQLPPEGYLAVYVGREQRRFIIRTEHINHPLLRSLLERTEEEFGVNPQGGLAIPGCGVVLFEHMLWMVENHADVHSSTLDDPAKLLDLYMHDVGQSTAANCSLEETDRMENNMPSSWSNNVVEPACGCTFRSAPIRRGYRRLLEPSQ